MCRSLGVSGLGRHPEPDTTSRGRLTLGGVQLNISGILGPALAGILLARLEAPFVFGLNAAGFLLVSMAIPALPRTGCDLGRTLIGFVRSITIAVRYVGQTQMYETSFFEM
jgi:hypothetical protein